jgi:hypothetical protein
VLPGGTAGAEGASDQRSGAGGRSPLARRPAGDYGGRGMATQHAGGRWLRPGAAAAIAAAGVLVPAIYTVATYEASHGPFGYLAGVGVLMLLVVCLAVAGLLGAALVGGWSGTGPLLAGLLGACVGFEVLYVVALGKPVDVTGTVQLFFICAVPLLVGYGIGRGLARLG